MPELPEVHTTATMLGKLVVGRTIADVWTDYNSPHYAGKDNIKNPAFFATFRKTLIGTRIVKTHRRGKNVLIDVETDSKNGGKKADTKNIAKHTIIVHMKMTGHLLYGKYKKAELKRAGAGAKTNVSWQAISPEALKDPFSRFVHMMISFADGTHLALADVRKFAKVTVVPTASAHESEHLASIGPEPLDPTFTLPLFHERLLTKPTGKIKLVLMNPEVLAGIGNIYSDEILWAAGVHPASTVEKVPLAKMKEIYTKSKEILKKGISFGGDSTSDYRNPIGERGEFHYHHHAYRNTNKACERRGCTGTIRRLAMGGRGAHFCDTHQTLFK
ncbi:MAG: DNA-formamidopyrimidine glycosylase family protein [bacterium]